MPKDNKSSGKGRGASNTNEPHLCTLCGTLVKNREMGIHRAQSHPDDPEVTPCPYCKDYAVKSDNNLNIYAHIRSLHTLIPLLCHKSPASECNFWTFYDNALRKHTCGIHDGKKFKVGPPRPPIEPPIPLPGRPLVQPHSTEYHRGKLASPSSRKRRSQSKRDESVSTSTLSTETPQLLTPPPLSHMKVETYSPSPFQASHPPLPTASQVSHQALLEHQSHTNQFCKEQYSQPAFAYGATNHLGLYHGDEEHQAFPEHQSHTNQFFKEQYSQPAFAYGATDHLGLYHYNEEQATSAQHVYSSTQALPSSVSQGEMVYNGSSTNQSHSIFAASSPHLASTYIYPQESIIDTNIPHIEQYQAFPPLSDPWAQQGQPHPQEVYNEGPDYPLYTSDPFANIPEAYDQSYSHWLPLFDPSGVQFE